MKYILLQKDLENYLNIVSQMFKIIFNISFQNETQTGSNFYFVIKKVLRKKSNFLVNFFHVNQKCVYHLFNKTECCCMPGLSNCYWKKRVLSVEVIVMLP